MNEEQQLTLLSADKNVAMFDVGGNRVKVRKFQSVDTADGKWVFTQFIPATESDNNVASVIITKEAASATAPTKIETLEVGESINL